MEVPCNQLQKVPLIKMERREATKKVLGSEFTETVDNYEEPSVAAAVMV